MDVGSLRFKFGERTFVRQFSSARISRFPFRELVVFSTLTIDYTIPTTGKSQFPLGELVVHSEEDDEEEDEDEDESQFPIRELVVLSGFK